MSARGLSFTAFAATALHTTLSFLVISPAYLPKLYLARDGSTGFTTSAEGALLAGATGLVVLGVAVAPRPEPRREGLAVLALVLTLAHTTLLGGAGWLEPGRWPHGLPPITLLSAVYAVGVLVSARLRRPA